MKVDKEIFEFMGFVTLLSVLIFGGFIISIRCADMIQASNSNDSNDISPDFIVEAEIISNDLRTINGATNGATKEVSDINKDKQLVFEEGDVKVYRFYHKGNYHYVVIGSGHYVGIK